MTGIDFDNAFERKINQAYSDWYDKATQRKSLYAEALFKTIEDIYKVLDEQREYDYLHSLVTTENRYNLTTSAINLADINTPYYFHLLSAKVRCKDYNFDNVPRKVDQTTVPYRVVFGRKTALRTGEILYDVDNEVYYYVKQRGTFEYELYMDKNLTVESGLVNDAALGTNLARYVEYYAKPLFSDRKISMFGKPDIYRPKYQIGDSKLKFYPIATAVELDYVNLPPVVIDPESSVELNAYYPDKFLYRVIDTASEIYFISVKDQSYGIQKQENFSELN